MKVKVVSTGEEGTTINIQNDTCLLKGINKSFPEQELEVTRDIEMGLVYRPDAQAGMIQKGGIPSISS